MQIPDLPITSTAPISSAFLAKGLKTFVEAADFVGKLPYGRNANKSDLTTVFNDNCGTCSTKHALLKKLAEENGFHDLKLFLGIFKMHAGNTPRVEETLARASLDYLPEAHNYLKYKGQVLDFTFGKAVDEPFFLKDLILEIEIPANAITAFKVTFHKTYLNTWLEENRIPLTMEQVWAVRERCIAALG